MLIIPFPDQDGSALVPNTPPRQYNEIIDKMYNYMTWPFWTTTRDWTPSNDRSACLMADQIGLITMAPLRWYIAIAGSAGKHRSQAIDFNLRSMRYVWTEMKPICAMPPLVIAIDKQCFVIMATYGLLGWPITVRFHRNSFHYNNYLKIVLLLWPREPCRVLIHRWYDSSQ